MIKIDMLMLNMYMMFQINIKILPTQSENKLKSHSILHTEDMKLKPGFRFKLRIKDPVAWYIHAPHIKVIPKIMRQLKILHAGNSFCCDGLLTLVSEVNMKVGGTQHILSSVPLTWCTT